jgi:HSP20 family molecular chaperone IbpA
MQKQEAQAPQGAEFTRARRVFMPRADIYEIPEAIVLVADMPGVDEKGVDITLEKNVLTISGHVEPEKVAENARLAYEEYEVGDYQRVFTLSDEVDREHIEAALKNGVLRVTLPKAGAAKTKKISVKVE